MKDKKVIIGIGLLAVGTIGYFVLKNKKTKKDIAEAESLVIDDSDVSEADINYLSSNGSSPVNVKKYLTYLKNNPTDSRRILLNRRIFSLIDNLNIRNDQFVDASTRVGVVPKKFTYLGRIGGLGLDENKELWFRIYPASSNLKLKDSFNWGIGKFNPFIRYVKASAVVAQL
jgi:hypothetical protein